jgi:hypothetical protein
MAELLEIEKRITSLSKEELILFRNWFNEFDNQVWDKQFENDVTSGKLNGLGTSALNEFKNGDFSSL